MGRTPRFTYARAVHHVTMRCNNKEFLFDQPSFQWYLDVLFEACDRFGVHLYDYCLMTNHVHLLFQVPADDVLSPFMHRVANRFANRFNAARKRKGHLWEGRFLSTIIEAPPYFLRTMAYVDLNPVRARMVKHPADYPWSGHRHLRSGDAELIEFHPIYLGLGKTPEARYRAYLRILEEEAKLPLHSLARALFVGRSDFVSRMRKRFAVVDGRLPRVESTDLGGGVRAIQLRPSRPQKP